MVKGCGNTLIKILFFTANLLICIFGALIFGFSLWANLDKDFALNLDKLAKEVHHEDINVLAKYQASLWVLVAVGALLFLVGFLGCCGALCESTALLTLFFIIVFALTIIEVGAAVFAITSKGQFKEALHKVLTESGDTTDETILQNLKPIEDVFNCCGATEETKANFIEAGQCPGEQRNLPDCFTVIGDWFEATSEVVIVIAFVLFLIELFAMISTCILCRAFRSRNSYYYA